MTITATAKGNEMTILKDSIGREYEISAWGIAALKAAKTAREADAAFGGMSTDVPPMSRCAVWQAVDELD